MKYVLFFLGLISFGNAFLQRHEFPLLGPRGEQVANEFQMILPEKILMPKLKLEEYSIGISSPLQIDNDDVVTVRYKTMKPTSSDWIGAYSPADVDITTTAPIKYGWCDYSPDYYSSGTGELQFNLTNVRSAVAFYYFTEGTKTPILVAKAEEVVTFRNFNEPLRPRIVPSGDPDVFKLLWSSATSEVRSLSPTGCFA